MFKYDRVYEKSEMSILNKIKMLFSKKLYIQDTFKRYTVKYTYKIYKNKIYLLNEDVMLNDLPTM